ncbi:MAG: hypothetical protein JJU44_06390 [Planctomycetes bacterium]|nr:hypothetical protein [Planctomycetota bacterium]
MTTPAPHPDRLPDALTFFLTRAERRAVLRKLDAPAHARTRALLGALGLPAGDKPQRAQRTHSKQDQGTSHASEHPPSRPSRSSR